MEKKAVFQERLRKVTELLKKTEMDALLLHMTPNIAYLTGTVNSCSWILITRRGEQVALILDSDVYAYKEKSVISNIRTFSDHPAFHLFKSVTKELGLTHSKIGLELGNPSLTQPTIDMLRYAFPLSVQFVNGALLEEIQVIKSKQQVEAIKNAVKIVELGMETAIKTIKPGIRENEIILETEYTMRKAGGRIPITNYIASGKRSCLAHQGPSQKKIEKGDVITLDIHGAFSGYCADLSRTVVCGKVNKEVEHAYSCLIKAEEETIDLCRKGEKLANIRKTFYRKLSEAKNLKFLMGEVLHGVGIMIREMPYFQFPHHERGYPEIMETNMVIAVSNIGLYSKQGWGVRVEDTVLVTKNEPVYLTHFTKELLSI